MKGLTKQHHAALSMRKQGMTFRDIGSYLGVGTNRANIIWHEADEWQKRTPRWTDGLPKRVCDLMWMLGIETKEDAIQRIQEKRISTKYRGYGKTSHRTLLKFLGLPIPVTKPKRPAICPHCGKEF